MALDVVKLEERIDRTAAGATVVDMKLGGVEFRSMIEVMEFAKLMACAKEAVPIHCRGEPGVCLGILTKALRFGFEPFSLAEHSYLMKKRSKNAEGQWVEDGVIAYDSFVIHAIIEAHGDLTGALRPRYEGEGENLKCTVYGTPAGEKVPLEHESPTLAELIRARGKNEHGKIKGSPLWETKPKVQIFYDTRRDWCRLYRPQILLGWYDKDEFYDRLTPDAGKELAPPSGLSQRLPGRKGARGFNPEHIEAQVGLPAPTTPSPPTEPPAANPAPSGGEPVSAPPDAPDKPTGAAEAGAPVEIALPKTEAEYRTHVAGSLAGFTEHGSIMPWWNSPAQRKLRNACGITQAPHDELRADAMARAALLKTQAENSK